MSDLEAEDQYKLTQFCSSCPSCRFPFVETTSIYGLPCSHGICFLCLVRQRELPFTTSDGGVPCPICNALFRPHIDEKKLYPMFDIGPCDQNAKKTISAITTARGECLIDNVETYINYEEGRIVYLEKEFNQNETVIQGLRKQIDAAQELNHHFVAFLSEQQATYASTISQCDNLHREIAQADSELDALRRQLPGHSPKP